MSQDESKPSDIPEPKSKDRPLPLAWQPLTARGVAAFSSATLGRLLLVQFMVALLAAGAVLWFLASVWFPTIRLAIRQLPQTGLIQQQQLSSPRASSEPLADTRFLAFVMDVNETGIPNLSTDLRVEFHQRHFALCSPLGCLTSSYPKDWNVQFNRPELESRWGAWEPMIYSLAGLAVVGGLFTHWLVLATFYWPAARLYCFFKDRQATLLGSWKLSAAALLPAALLTVVAIVLYGQGLIDFLRFLILCALSLPVGWIYLFASPLHLPRTSDAVQALQHNPFGTEKT